MLDIINPDDYPCERPAGDGYLAIERVSSGQSLIYFNQIRWWSERIHGLLIAYNDDQKYNRILIPWHDIKEIAVKCNSADTVAQIRKWRAVHGT